jgi:hypothetical protein
MGEFLFDPTAAAAEVMTVKIPEHTQGGVVEHRYEVVGMTRKGGQRMGLLQKQANAARKKADGNGGLMVNDVIEMEAASYITGLDIMLRPINGAKPAGEVLRAFWEDDALDVSVDRIRALFRHVMEAQADPPA